MRASERSTLLTTTMIGRFLASALRSTNRVWGSGPSDASTSSSTPSTISRPRSTSPPKSAWPGVSMMLMITSDPSGAWCSTAVFLARIVMPFSRSRSIESMTRLFTSWLARNAPDCHSMASTRVVLPWSTWATMATLRRSARTGMAGCFLFRLRGGPGVTPGLGPATLTSGQPDESTRPTTTGGPLARDARWAVAAAHPEVPFTSTSPADRLVQAQDEGQPRRRDAAVQPFDGFGAVSPPVTRLCSIWAPRCATGVAAERGQHRRSSSRWPN